jgi:hypothetical protein
MIQEGALSLKIEWPVPGIDLTPERPTAAACERRFLADSANSTKDSEADIREGWEGLADGQNGRGRLTERPLGEACSQSNKADVSEAALPDATHRALP